jgi:hypothetical protein
MTQFDHLEFEEGVAVTLTNTNGANFNIVTLDIQEHGVLFDYVDGSVTKRMFRPWNSISSINQTVSP